MSDLKHDVANIICQYNCDSRRPGGLDECPIAQSHINCAEAVLKAADKANPPGHDYASTTASHESLATQRDGYKYFGFGRGPSVVKA